MNTTRVILRPETGAAWPNLGELWQYRDLWWTLGQRDLRLRYRQTVLGVLWVLVQPLVAAGIFAVVFGRIARLDSGELPYFLVGFSGFLAWSSFQSTVTKASASLLANSQMLTKIFFPRLILPLASLLTTAVDFAVALALFVVLAGLRGFWPGPAFLLVPLWLLSLQAIAMGIGLATAAWSSRYRDVQHLLPTMLQLVMYGSPVAYMLSAVSDERIRNILALNPITPAIEGLRWSLLGTVPPSGSSIAYLAVVSVSVLLIGVTVFMRADRDLADVI